MAAVSYFEAAVYSLLLCAGITPLVCATGTTSEARATAEGGVSVGDPRNCHVKQQDPELNVMQVIPGVGWDNLRNIEMAPVLDISYSLCKSSPDGKYLIPDETHILPVRESVVENNAEFIDHLDSYESVTSHSINAGLNAKFLAFGKLSGKFSAEYQRLKSSQFKESAATVQIQLRHNFYTINQLPDSTLHPRFKTRLLEIASFLKTNDSSSADYVAQMILRDFGTHFLTSLDVGAVLVRQDNYKSSVLKNNRGRIKSLTVGAEFEVTYKQLVGGGASLGYRGSHGNGEAHTDAQNRTSSKMYTYGGPPYRLGMNVSEWESNLANNLVAIDRVGKPLHLAITSQSMQPEIESTYEVNEIQRRVFEAIKQYYAVNTRIGCTDPSAPGFDYQANIGTATCNAGATNFTFGGVFQTCVSNRSEYETEICGDLVQKNYITGSTSCPHGFEPVLLLKDKTVRVFERRTCKKKCKYLIFKCHQDLVCEDVGEASYTTFWCAPRTNQTNPSGGYLFGGVYSEDTNIQNVVTRDFSCPKAFLPMKLGLNARVCVSEDREVARNLSVPFGGLFSCQSGNKLAENPLGGDFKQEWEKACPSGYTEHVATINNDCSVKYCVKAGLLLRGTELDLMQPPFLPKPPLKGRSHSFRESLMSSNRASMAVFSPVSLLLVFLPNVIMKFP